MLAQLKWQYFGCQLSNVNFAQLYCSNFTHKSLITAVFRLHVFDQTVEASVLTFQQTQGQNST